MTPIPPMPETLFLRRDDDNGARMFGAFFVGTTRQCETLEPSASHPVPERRCIPAGTYTARLRYSPSHGYAVYGYVNVPGFTDVEIHAGNDVLDTKACTLVGDSRGKVTVAGQSLDAVLNSRTTFRQFMAARGCPDFQTLTTWDAVRAYLVAHPNAAEFTVVVADPFPALPTLSPLPPIPRG